MAEASFEERTEKATPRRRKEAKNKGQIARSREIPSVVILLGGMTILLLFGTAMYFQLSNLMVQWLGRMATVSVQWGGLQALSWELVVSFLFIVGPVLAVVFVVAVLGHTIQGSNVFSTELIKPNWGKLNVVNGLKRMFTMQSLVELLKSLVKMVIVGGIAYSTIKKEWPDILLLFGQDAGNVFHFVSALSLRLLLRTVLVMVVLAALDYAYQRWSHEKNLKMSKQEIKEEMKQTEGDPLIKSRIRTVQRQLARQRMMAEVPKADVIITNPTHLAIALLYDPKTMEAPHVVAKGAGYIAQKIVEIGRSHQVPIVENKPLARMLYKAVDVGRTIPSNVYHAVADILAYVYQIKKKRL
ncbi:MAG: flagellar biosynthesis protein FlhB [Deltaproteobacteria bacterium RBG_13_52_11b]|nr:MAG: flagellar biosynthesis protein FlhB [Deltaproteobacteria bacterium RBG_13_52_11b]